MKAIVVGGGIAGLSTAVYLARSRADQVTVFEQAPRPFTQSSATNAAIFRPLETCGAIVELAARSYRLLAEFALGVKTIGLVLCASRVEALDPLLTAARAFGVSHELLADDALYTRAEVLRDGRARVGVWLPEGGVLPIAAMARKLCDAAAAYGVSIRTNDPVSGIETQSDRCRGVRTQTGEFIPGDQIVLAAGAWAGALGKSCGCELPLQAYRRHLVQLDVPEAQAEPFELARWNAAMPVCWNVETDIYFRPEEGGLLACPGDDTPHLSSLPQVDPAQVSRLLGELPTHAPQLSWTGVRRSWSCLRTMTLDEIPVIGPDPRCSGLFWLAGLGGHGMTIGLAAGEMLANLMTGGIHPHAAAFDVARLSPA